MPSSLLCILRSSAIQMLLLAWNGIRRRFIPGSAAGLTSNQLESVQSSLPWSSSLRISLLIVAYALVARAFDNDWITDDVEAFALAKLLPALAVLPFKQWRDVVKHALPCWVRSVREDRPPDVGE